MLRKLSAQDDYEQSATHQAIDLAKASKYEMGVYNAKLENLHQDPIQVDLHCIHQTVQQSDSSRREIYLRMNPYLRQHLLYLTNNIPEYVWKAFIWVRLGSHWLKIETER